MVSEVNSIEGSTHLEESSLRELFQQDIQLGLSRMEAFASRFCPQNGNNGSRYERYEPMQIEQSCSYIMVNNICYYPLGMDRIHAQGV